MRCRDAIEKGLAEFVFIVREVNVAKLEIGDDFVNGADFIYQLGY